MIFIIIVLNKSMVTKLNYHSLIKHRQFKMKLKICINAFGKIKINLIMVNILKTLHILIKQTRKLLVSLKMKVVGFLL